MAAKAEQDWHAAERVRDLRVRRYQERSEVQRLRSKIEQLEGELEYHEDMAASDAGRAMAIPDCGSPQESGSQGGFVAEAGMGEGGGRGSAVGRGNGNGCRERAASTAWARS